MPNFESTLKGMADRLRAAARRGLDLVDRVATPVVDLSTSASSPKAVGRELATSADVVTAYKLLLRRTPDPDGLHLYRKWVARGVTLDDLVGSFMASDEFRQQIVPRLSGEFKAMIRQQALTEDVVNVDLGGYVVCVRASDSDFGRAIVATGDYEPHVRRFLLDSVKPGDVVIDVGANVGCLTFQAAKLVGERGRVIAVEPNPENLQLLYAGILRNELINVQVVPCAAWNTAGVMSLKGGASNTYLVSAAPLDEGRAYTQLVRLDEALANLDRVDLIKLDIEGHEPQAIEGARRLIEKHRPTVLTEFNPRCLREVSGIAAIDYAEQLLSYHSRLRVITPFGDDTEFGDARSLMAHWEQRNAVLTRDAVLPDGMLHFDIVATTDG
jgi:FkbM family methyltransferase